LTSKLHPRFQASNRPSMPTAAGDSELRVESSDRCKIRPDDHSVRGDLRARLDPGKATAQASRARSTPLAIQRLATSCPVAPCRVVSCRVVSCRSIPSELEPVARLHGTPFAIIPHGRAGTTATASLTKNRQTPLFTLWIPRQTLHPRRSFSRSCTPKPALARARRS
jgi:hypothetical protein